MRFFKSEPIIIAILLLSLFLRLYDLGKESLWIDEGTSLQLAQTSVAHIIENRSQTVNPPLYFILLHYWVSMFGASEFSARFISAIFGFLATLMIYKLGHLFWGKRVALISALILAIALYHINYSQEARGYSMMVLLALTSMYFYVKLLSGLNWLSVTGYILSSSVLMYTHFFGLFTIVAQNIFFLTTFINSSTYQFSLKRWLAIQGALIILFLPWLHFLITQVLVIQNGYWIPTPTLYSIVGSFLEYASKSQVLLLGFLILALLPLLTFWIDRNRNNQRQFIKAGGNNQSYRNLSNAAKIYLLLLWLATPVLLPFIISQFSTSIYYTRYTITASLAFYIFIAAGIQKINNRYAQATIIALIIVVSASPIYRYYVQVRKQQWREVVSYIEENAQPGDLLLFNPGGIKESAFAYYYKRNDLDLKPFDLSTDIITEQAGLVQTKGIADLEKVVEGYNNVWLIQAHSNDYSGIIKTRLGELYDYSDQRQYLGIELNLFRQTGVTLGANSEVH